MPIDPRIATSAAIYRQDVGPLEKSYEGLTADEWNRRPNETTNSMMWIVCHLTWARSRVLAMMGVKWDRPWLSLFGRGSKMADLSQYPSPEEAAAAWKEVAVALDAAFESISADAVAGPAPEKGPPSFDGTLGGAIGFMAFHDTYHVGQASYLSRWLGHGQIMG